MSKRKIPSIKKSKHSRKKSFWVFVLVVLFFLICFFAAKGFWNTDKIFDPCGFKLKYGLPCPTCGMTRSMKLFCSGELVDAFIVQPAGAFICLLLAIIAVFSGLELILGLNLGIISFITNAKNIGYIVVVIALIVMLGWLVLLARAVSFYPV